MPTTVRAKNGGAAVRCLGYSIARMDLGICNTAGASDTNSLQRGKKWWPDFGEFTTRSGCDVLCVNMDEPGLKRGLNHAE